MMMTAVPLNPITLDGLRPHSHGIRIVSRQSTPGRCPSRNVSQMSRRSATSTGTSVRSTPDPSLSMVDIECILQDDLRSAFQVYDAECNLTITKGEFHSVVESFLIPLTEGQFEELLAKVSKNLKNTVRAFCLFDYNRDGRIQKHKFRRVIKSYCFQMTNKEFSKLWSHFDVSNSGTLSYAEFLQKLGLEINNRRVPESTQLGGRDLVQ